MLEGEVRGDTPLVVGAPIGAEGTQQRAVAVLLLTVEIDVQFLHTSRQSAAERCRATFGHKAVDVGGNHSQHAEFQAVVDLIASQRLEIGIVGGVAALGFETSQDIAVAVAAETRCIGPTLPHPALDRGRSPQETDAGRAFEFAGTDVGDVKYRREFVAIGGVESSRREKDMFHQVGIDDAHALLLPAAYQHRPEDLDIVDVDEVLVERTATHGIL